MTGQECTANALKKPSPSLSIHFGTKIVIFIVALILFPLHSSNLQLLFYQEFQCTSDSLRHFDNSIM